MSTSRDEVSGFPDPPPDDADEIAWEIWERTIEAIELGRLEAEE